MNNPNESTSGAANPNDRSIPNELKVVADLRSAITGDVTDIGDELRMRARALPLAAFAPVYAFDWCEGVRGLNNGNLEMKNLNLVANRWEGFDVIPIGEITPESFLVMRRSVESTTSTSGVPYQFRTCKVIVHTVGRLFQLLALPPFRIIDVDRACEILSVIDYEGKLLSPV